MYTNTVQQVLKYYITAYHMADIKHSHRLPEVMRECDTVMKRYNSTILNGIQD